MNVYHRCKLHPDPTLTLCGAQIQVVTQPKFLGVVFDSELNIDNVNIQSENAMDLLKMVSKIQHLM